MCSTAVKLWYSLSCAKYNTEETCWFWVGLKPDKENKDVKTTSDENKNIWSVIYWHSETKSLLAKDIAPRPTNYTIQQKNLTNLFLSESAITTSRESTSVPTQTLQYFHPTILCLPCHQYCWWPFMSWLCLAFICSRQSMQVPRNVGTNYLLKLLPLILQLHRTFLQLLAMAFHHNEHALFPSCHVQT